MPDGKKNIEEILAAWMIGFHDFVGNLTEKIDNALVDSMLLMFYQMLEENPIIFDDIA